jgi:energy-coupling factor transporter ATP-binding protein EcfA2
MALITALMRLRGALAGSKLPIDVVGADEARLEQKAMLDQLDDYILPRLVQIEAPVLAVVGGSTGAGKSTLVNTLIGQLVSEPGVLRPTTRSPVLIHNPVDAEWFTGERVLPGLARSSGEKPGGIEDPGSIRLVAADTVPQGLAILDAPDVDSVVEANRELATQLLAAADLWLFVTTAARYSDAVPWDFLTRAAGRSTAVAVVLDRAPTDTVDDITGHLAQMLLEQGLGDSPLFSIPETVVDGNGMLPAELVVSIKDWLTDLAADADARSAVVRRTLQGAVTAMTKKTPAFATAVRAQADTIVELRSNAETEYEQAVNDVAKATQDGTMLRGEVLARWQEFVGTGELLKGLQTNVGRMRDKMKSAVVGKSPPTRDLNDAVESGLESLLREHAEAAAERAQESWQSTVAGRQLLALGDRDLGRMSKTFPAEASRVVRGWQGFVLDLVRKEGAENRSTAKVLAYGVNGLGLALMIVIFASTGDTTGGKAGPGAGTAVVGRKLLEAVFGNQAVRGLAAKAREDLDSRVHALMDAEFARYLAVVDQHPVDPDAPRRLTEAARAVEDCT